MQMDLVNLQAFHMIMVNIKDLELHHMHRINTLTQVVLLLLSLNT